MKISSRLKKYKLKKKVESSSLFTCVYWNAKGVVDAKWMVDILKDRKPQLFFIAEMHPTFLELNLHLIELKGYEVFENPGCDRITIFRKKGLNLELGLLSKYYTVMEVPLLNLHIISVHFSSSMHQHMEALKDVFRDFRIRVDTELGNSIERSILVIGDFNVNPFESPMIDFNGFLATNSTHARSAITHLERNKTTYYNPTWKLYSRTHFPGTKRYNRPSGAAFDIIEFHYLDQVVLSQHLRKRILWDQIDIIEETSDFIFFDKARNKSKVSDHLPLLYEFKLA